MHSSMLRMYVDVYTMWMILEHTLLLTQAFAAWFVYIIFQ
jgi:hypothetical protein